MLFCFTNNPKTASVHVINNPIFLLLKDQLPGNPDSEQVSGHHLLLTLKYGIYTKYTYLKFVIIYYVLYHRERI
jgi:hypothetical protein